MIDTSMLPTEIDQESWGYSNNDVILGHYRTIMDMIKPKTMIEIGMFVGHSTAAWLQFSDTNIHVFDPSPRALAAAAGIKAHYGDRFTFTNSGLSTGFDIDPDLIFIDGSHREVKVFNDIQASLSYDPKWILFDNVELQDVRNAMKDFNMMDERLNPQYFFYTNTHKGRTNPGIMALIDMERYYES